MNSKELGVHGRKLMFCPDTQAFSVPELIRECPSCNAFVLYCCACTNKLRELSESSRPSTPCHHFRIMFTDGACTNNGRHSAKAGVGVAYGNNDGSQLSKPITDTLDNSSVRTSQRAELCAARLGLESFAKVQLRELKTEPESWIIATDSEYVVKGMTEWLPTWKNNNWRTSKGTRPANLDLFLALDSEMKTYEAMQVKIGLWHIPREHNQLADRLAKAAAVHGDEAGL